MTNAETAIRRPEFARELPRFVAELRRTSSRPRGRKGCTEPVATLRWPNHIRRTPARCRDPCVIQREGNILVGVVEGILESLGRLTPDRDIQECGPGYPVMGCSLLIILQIR